MEVAMKIRYLVVVVLLVLTTGCGQSSSLTTPTPSCSYLLSPTVQSVPAHGGTYTATMTTTAACQWTAKADMPWIQITAGSTGMTTGTITYVVGPNADVIRRGAISTQVSEGAPTTLTILQDGVTP